MDRDGRNALEFYAEVEPTVTTGLLLSDPKSRRAKLMIPIEHPAPLSAKFYTSAPLGRIHDRFSHSRHPLKATVLRKRAVESRRARMDAAASRIKLLKERKWPSQGPLILRDGIDVACQYCAHNYSGCGDFVHKEFADRRFASTDVLHEHVRTWHIERAQGSHKNVYLQNFILGCDGETKRDVVVDGPAVPVPQLEAAKKFGWTPAYPYNIAPRRDPSRTISSTGRPKNGHTSEEQFGYYTEYPDREDLPRDLPGYEKDFLGFRDIEQPGLFAHVQNQDMTTQIIPYGMFLSRRLARIPCALYGMADGKGSTRIEFQELVDGHQNALVSMYVFRNGQGWIIHCEEWMEYKQYMQLKEKGHKVVIRDMMDGLGIRRGLFRPIIDRSREEARCWLGEIAN